MTDETEKALFLRRFDVPFRALSYLFGRYPMYRQRTGQTPGRNSIVGTAVKSAEDLPKHVIADEKHTSAGDGKAYVAAAAGGERILGVSVTFGAGEKAPEEAYGIYKQEARNAEPGYAPDTCRRRWTEGDPERTEKPFSVRGGASVLPACVHRHPGSGRNAVRRDLLRSGFRAAELLSGRDKGGFLPESEAAPRTGRKSLPSFSY